MVTMMGFLLARYRKFFIAFLIILIFFGILRFALPYGVTAYRSLYVVSHIIPAVPQWFEFGRYEAELREESMGSAAPPAGGASLAPSERDPVVDIYLPVGIDQASFVIFFPGFNPEGSRDPRLVNLARSFAGAGIGVAVPDSENIKQKTFSREDIELIKSTFYFLQDQAYVDPDRIGLSGFSIAGSYILRAASELGTGLLFVHSLGGYYDLEELFAEVISKRVVYNGAERAWEPDSLSQELAQEMLRDEPQDFSLKLRELSPSAKLQDMNTRVFLMHDRNDNLIPVEESRKIRDALPRDISVSYSEFSLFRHVTPRAFLSLDILKLSGQVLSIMRLLQ